MAEGRVQVNAEAAFQLDAEIGSEAGCAPQATLALPARIPDIAAGRLARDVSLANRVRSGRKQP